MPTSNLTRAEKIAFNSDLNRNMAEETRQEQRAERVEAYANFLMEEGQEYYPFTPARVSEALGELSTGQLAVIAACLAEVEAHKRSDANRNHLALCSIIQPIKEYWRDMAMKEAERHIE